ncbi:methyl-accepting chemotaxis protein [Neptunomonas japonica]|uniref:methyl-accepting chemotaxis protein n=1 Tax=Neptunomonas japonica TaxID=417574 RepID=UPI0003FEF19B|nr:methyl-accepting chemotaxis protein [Neptunomonas japonica]
MSGMFAFLSAFSMRGLIFFNSLLLLMLLAISFTFSIFSMAQVGQELEGIAEQDIPLTASLISITEHQLEQTIHLERALRHGQPAVVGGSVDTETVNKEVSKFDQLSLRVANEIKHSAKQAKEVISHAHNDEERDEFSHVLAELKSIGVKHYTFEQHSHRLFEVIKQRRSEELSILASEVEHESDELTQALESLLHEISVFTGNAAISAKEHEQEAMTTLSVIMAISVIVGILATYLIGRIIWGQLGIEPKDMQLLSQRIADGNLSAKALNADKERGVFSSLIRMEDSLKRLVFGIKSGSQQVAEASNNLITIAENTNQGLNFQHQNTEQVATAVTQMTASAEEVVRNTASAADAAAKAKNQLDEGGVLVESTVDGIHGLSQQLNETMVDIAKLEQGAMEITGILDVIKRIADQTNLLALNAAIEAARAGEQGRGFAVVADEVRSLAKSTQESASEIESMIISLQSSASSSINSMRLGSDQAVTLLSRSSQVTASLSEIQQTVSDISDMNAQIASAAQEQKSVSLHINQNIVEISTMSKETSQDSENLIVTSAALAELASKLLGSVKRFKV